MQCKVKREENLCFIYCCGVSISRNLCAFCLILIYCKLNIINKDENNKRRRRLSQMFSRKKVVKDKEIKFFEDVEEITELIKEKVN